MVATAERRERVGIVDIHSALKGAGHFLRDHFPTRSLKTISENYRRVLAAPIPGISQEQLVQALKDAHYSYRVTEEGLTTATSPNSSPLEQLEFDKQGRLVRWIVDSLDNDNPYSFQAKVTYGYNQDGYLTDLHQVVIFGGKSDEGASSEKEYSDKYTYASQPDGTITLDSITRTPKKGTILVQFLN